MPEYKVNYNFSSIYVLIIASLYSLLHSNFNILSIFSSSYFSNYAYAFLIVNIIGILIILTRMKFEFNFKLSF